MKSLLIVFTVAFGSVAFAQNADIKWPDCYCTDKTGQRIELGETICMSVDGRSYLAQCQMSLNNPMWREVAGDCLVSELPQTKKDVAG